MIGIMFLIFAICMILAIPVGFSIAISATAFLFFDAGIPIFSIVQKMVDGINYVRSYADGTQAACIIPFLSRYGSATLPPFP